MEQYKSLHKRSLLPTQQPPQRCPADPQPLGSLTLIVAALYKNPPCNLLLDFLHGTIKRQRGIRSRYQVPLLLLQHIPDGFR